MGHGPWGRKELDMTEATKHKRLGLEVGTEV